MAKSYVTYPGDGATTTYAVTFPYLARLHVHVLIGGVETDKWEWLTPSSIKLDSPTSDILTIIRVTPTDPIVDFTDGSVLTENQLDIATIQSLYVCEETQDAVKYALSNVPEGPDEEVPGDGINWNAKNLKIINLKNGTLPKDAINKEQLDAIVPIIDEEVRRAEEAAEAAEASAAVAESAKNAALNSANKSEAEAIKAKNAADAAKASENAARGHENEAEESAVEAAVYAKNSKDYSESSKDSAEASKDAELQSKQHAADAKEHSETAEGHASNAQKAKNDAQASASAAEMSENNAVSSSIKAEKSANKAAYHEYRAQEIVDNFNPALNFRGSVDITQPSPDLPYNGDTYLVEATASAHSSWGSLSGTTVSKDSLVVWSGDRSIKGDTSLEGLGIPCHDKLLVDFDGTVEIGMATTSTASVVSDITSADNDWHNTGSVTDQPANGITQEDIDNWNEAHSWGNHSGAGYLKNETDPVFKASPAGTITADDIDTWNNPPSGLPSQTGQKGNYLRTTGDTAYWAPVEGGGGSGDTPSLVADDCIYLNRQEIVNDYAMPDGFNGMTAGPITQKGDVYISEGSAWTIVGGGGSGSSDELQQKVDYLEDKVYKIETLLRQIGKQTEKG